VNRIIIKYESVRPWFVIRVPNETYIEVSQSQLDMPRLEVASASFRKLEGSNWIERSELGKVSIFSVHSVAELTSFLIT